MPAQQDRIVAVAERLACGDADLLADQIEPADHLADRVLDLDARVHLEEEELVARDERLDRADAVVADRLRRADPRFAQARADAFADLRGRLFEELLVAPLQRTIPLADVHDVPMFIGEDLQLDVLGIIEIPFDVDRRVLEVGFRLALRSRERRGDLGERARDLEALAAAAARGFDRDREAELAGRGFRFGDAFDRLRPARDDGDARGDHRLPGTNLVAHRIDRAPDAGRPKSAPPR